MAFRTRLQERLTIPTRGRQAARETDPFQGYAVTGGRIEAPEADNGKLDFELPQPQRSGQRVITLEGIHHTYGENVVYGGIDFQAERGQRIVLIGSNGAGKSTLLKILAGPGVGP